MKIIEVRFLINKFGNLLLLKNENDSSLEVGKWILPGGPIKLNENLQKAVNKILHESSGWKCRDIRLFKIATFSDKQDNILHEIVFIIEAVSKMPDQDKPTRWVPLNDLSLKQEIAKDHLEIINSYKELVHRGKTLDLERLPPVIDLKNPSLIKAQLLDQPS